MQHISMLSIVGMYVCTGYNLVLVSHAPTSWRRYTDNTGVRQTHDTAHKQNTPTVKKGYVS